MGLGCVLSIVDSEGVEPPVSVHAHCHQQNNIIPKLTMKRPPAIVFGVKKYHQYLYGRHFNIKCNHKPLLSIYGPKTGRYNLFAVGLDNRAMLCFCRVSDLTFSMLSLIKIVLNALSHLALNVKHHEPDEFMWDVFTATWKAPVDCQQVKIETQKTMCYGKCMVS